MIPTTEHLTANDLDAMPRRATVFDCDGERWHKTADGWWRWEDNDLAGLAACIIDTYGPLSITPPTVLVTPEQLSKLDDGSIILDSDGDAWQRTDGEWRCTVPGMDIRQPPELYRLFGPISLVLARTVGGAAPPEATVPTA